jgi:hypothetical protein
MLEVEQKNTLSKNYPYEKRGSKAYPATPVNSSSQLPDSNNATTSSKLQTWSATPASIAEIEGTTRIPLAYHRNSQ